MAVSAVNAEIASTKYVGDQITATAVTGISIPVGSATATSSTTWASIWVE
jgi:hypothetical protein